MSQIEQEFRTFLSVRPELTKCYNAGLINRRSLARYLVTHGFSDIDKIEAIVAMLRRFKFEDHDMKDQIIKFKDSRISVKDGITIINFEKERELVRKIRTIMEETKYHPGETLKIVMGSKNIKIFIDKEKEEKVVTSLKQFNLLDISTDVSEVCVSFPDPVIKGGGILSTITAEFLCHDIEIVELIAAKPELSIYLKEKNVLKAYEVLKRLKKSAIEKQ